VLAEVPAASLADDAPLYERPLAEPTDRADVAADDPTDAVDGIDLVEALCALLLDPVAVYRQYDHQLFLNTVIGPGADGALLRLQGPGLPTSERGMALSTDSNPRWCALDPRRGTAATVAEGVGNVAVTGASAVAVVNCLNFGNPEHPSVMWQLSEAIDGMGEACRALGLPVIGGNVSLYNESGGVDIDPTPVIGTLGLVESLVERPPSLAWHDGETVVLVGQRRGEDARPFALGGSRLAVEVLGRRGGELFDLDLGAVGTTAALVASLVSSHAAGRGGLVGAVHDVGAGGLAVALAEMAIAAGVGVAVAGIESAAELFAERPGRYVLTTSDVDGLLAAAAEAGVEAVVLGTVGGTAVVIDEFIDVDVAMLTARSEAALPNALSAVG
jgi:phosphoribosylformylglycinamidine synthase